jgi:UDPglucose 6-dehydrogenase
VPRTRALYGERDELVLCTEWKTFFAPNFEQMKKLMKRPLIIDGRNLCDPGYGTRSRFDYHRVGRGLAARRPNGQ